MFFQPVPPYLGFGSPEDSMQSCLTVTIPQPPKKDTVRYVANVSKVSNMGKQCGKNVTQKRPEITGEVFILTHNKQKFKKQNSALHM